MLASASSCTAFTLLSVPSRLAHQPPAITQGKRMREYRYNRLQMHACLGVNSLENFQSCCVGSWNLSQLLMYIQRWNLCVNPSQAVPIAMKGLKLNGYSGVKFCVEIGCWGNWLMRSRHLYAQNNSYMTVVSSIHTVISGFWMGPDVEDGWGYVEAFVDQYF
uniref:Uncharacterized protein n=1 Tax=Anthurium amnicola TaxID=1678845 RepID=A0A1D1ZM29_9ARAE